MARGGAGYVLIQRWNLLDSFFMTLITITTIGYSEMHPLTDAGRLFTSSLILEGVGVTLWTLGIFSEVLGTGQLAQYGRWKGTEAHRRRIRDHFIICGYGRMGTQIALEMCESNIPYVVVEHDPEVVRRLQRKGDLDHRKLAVIEAERAQAEGHVPNGSPVFGPGQRLPASIILPAEGCLVAVAGDCVGEHRTDGFPGHGAVDRGSRRICCLCHLG